MEKIFHYTSFDTFKKIIESGTVRFNSLTNVDDAEEGYLQDTQSQAPYTFVSCWTKSDTESIPLWKMYVDSPFAIRIGISPDFLKPELFKRHFIANTTNRNAYVFLIRRGGDRGAEFLSKVEYKDQPRLQMFENYRGILTKDYIESYGLTKSTFWQFQEEVRFIVQAVPVSRIRPRPNTPIYTICQDSIINNDHTDIKFIDIQYDMELMLTAEIMLGPSTTKEHINEIEEYINNNLPRFKGTLSRSQVYIRSK